jgi:hypothetical protein
MYGHATELQDAYYTRPFDTWPGMPAQTVYTQYRRQSASISLTSMAIRSTLTASPLGETAPGAPWMGAPGVDSSS